MWPCQLKREEVGGERESKTKRERDMTMVVSINSMSPTVRSETPLSYSTKVYMFSTKSSYVPPWEAGAKAAAEPMIEARIANFMVLLK